LGDIEFVCGNRNAFALGDAKKLRELSKVHELEDLE
jgi:hypothetical protein